MSDESAPGRKAMLAFAICGAFAVAGSAAATELRDFQNPPKSARPRVWWHWMNGNVSKEGIRADLEWMKRTGIGGFQNFDAAMFTPQVVDKRLVFMTPEWRDAFRYAITLADQLGLEAAIAGSPGWSESGGPWVKPEQGMKKVVWSETTLEGGVSYHGVLAKPPANAGPYLDAPVREGLANQVRSGDFYADTVVLAFRQAAAQEGGVAVPTISASSGNRIEADVLSDSSMVKAVALPKAPMSDSAWIRFDYGKPVTMRAVTIARSDYSPMEQFAPPAPGPVIEFSNDGENWQTVINVPGGAAAHTVAFAPATARYFRAVWVTRAAPPPPFPMDGAELDGLPGSASASSADYHIAELRFHSDARVLRGEEKAGFGMLPDFIDLPTPPSPADAVVAKDSIVNLTGRLHPDGKLNWTPPPGRWTVLRMGYSLTGVNNHPASPEGTGLEVDKLNAQHVRDYMNHYLDLYRDTTAGMMGKRGLQYMVSDSWEAGSANWTEDMLAQFKSRRGYDATSWLPALTGRVIGSAGETDRFLWDWRRTLSDLLAENHYAQITKILHDRGMGHYGESHESGRAFVGDGMEVKRSNDVPMSAMWTQTPSINKDQPGANADVRESASVAHIYGQNLVAAESMTTGFGAWRWSPATLKPTADKELAMGVNRFVIHTSVHQPFMDKGPGIGLGPFGQWFTRNETWAGAGAKAWVDYLARSSWMLQQGSFVADVAWFYGEDSNITALYDKAGPPIPEGYNFDYVNADALKHRFKLIGGQLGTDSGMRYRLLALAPRAVQMSLPVLKALRDLVMAGAIVVGPRPTSTPSLADDDREFQKIVKQVWGDGSEKGHLHGKGRVYENMALADVLTRTGVAPDFQYTKPTADTELLAVHRKLKDGDIYFVDSRNDKQQSLEASFRVTGRVPELWHAETGLSEPVAWRIEGGRTVVSLNLGPWQAVFVVFRRPTAAKSGVLPVQRRTIVATLDGKWQVSFQPGRHAPANAEIPLGSWSEQVDEGIKYFAGTGTYSRNLDVPVHWLAKNSQLWLDLGQVHELAEVSVNGKNMGVMWRPPYRVNIAPALRAGKNTIDIAVTNLWVNRLIHDARPDAKDAYTFTVPKFYKGVEPLLPSGLAGPVTLEQISPAH
ncbi:glycosyl hydrolase [Duganella sp. PWIR1]